MKNLITLLLMAGLLFTSCEGDPGPPGPEGPPGEPGVNVVGQTFEYENVDFDYFSDSNLYSSILEVPAEVEVLDSDAILVYRLEVVQDEGGDLETWSMIPQNFFLPEGIIQYVYNYTTADIELLIDGNFDLSGLGEEFTTGQVFRFVVVPSDFAQDPGVNVRDLQAVYKALDLEEQDVMEVRL